jgi:hypothetical protein
MCVKYKGEKYALVLDDQRVLVLLPGKIGADDLDRAISDGIDAGSQRFEVAGNLRGSKLLVDKIEAIKPDRSPSPLTGSPNP